VRRACRCVRAREDDRGIRLSAGRDRPSITTGLCRFYREMGQVIGSSTSFRKWGELQPVSTPMQRETKNGLQQ
jgi:hypothetical protein